MSHIGNCQFCLNRGKLFCLEGILLYFNFSV